MNILTYLRLQHIKLIGSILAVIHALDMFCIVVSKLLISPSHGFGGPANMITIIERTEF